MRTLLLLLAFSAPAFAQRNPPPIEPALPPPDIDEQGVVEAAPAEPESGSQDGDKPGGDPIFGELTVRQTKNGDVIQEYRKGGHVTMIRVVPKNGIPYQLMDINGDGRIDRRDADSNVAPVYFRILEWN